MWPEPLPQSLKHPLTRKIPSAGSLAKSSALLRTIPDAILSSANWLRRAYMRSSSGAAIPRSVRSVSIFRAPASWSHRPSAIPAPAWHEDRSRTHAYPVSPNLREEMRIIKLEMEEEHRAAVDEVFPSP